MNHVHATLWERCCRVLVFLALVSALLLPAYAADELSLSDVRAPQGDYTATLEEMAIKRLYAYGFLDAATEDEPQEEPAEDITERKKDCILPLCAEGTPNRLDAALMLYRACGTQPEAPCPLLDVPEEYADAVAWLYGSGATKGIGNQMYGTGIVTEEQFATMIARLLRWETDDLGIIEYVMRERGLVPSVAVDGAFTFGEMYQIVCNLLDHAYPDHCIPTSGKDLTPKAIEVYADSCENALEQIRKAVTYLPGSIDVVFSDNCPQGDIEAFRNSLNWTGGKKTMPLLALTNPRWNLPFEVQSKGTNHIRIIIDSYSQAAEASASVTNWLSVFKDDQ